ncbi:MAG: DUF2169 domain-containing protein [Pseudomonadota bacterium]
MWALKNTTPFAAAKAFERDRDGHEVLCLVVRATLRPGLDELWIAEDEQLPVLMVPELGEDEMIADADIAPFMPGSEIIVRGAVDGPLPPEGRIAQVQVGNIRHQLRLWPAQQARKVKQRVVVEALDDADLTLSWTHSAGGPLPDDTLHPDNPVGTGLLPPTEDEPVLLPRILGVDDRPDALHPGTRPVGLGPIHRHWAPRLEAAGTYDAAWEDTRAPLLPHDFDPRFYFSAPPPLQQAQAFRSGEPIVLSGFGPERDMQTRLPSVVITSMTEIGRARVEQRLALQRVSVDLDAGTVGLVWQTAVPCDGQDHLIRASTLRIKQVSGIAL